MNLHQETRLKDALKTLRELSLELEINLLHNYGYRELLQISEARGFFENLEKARGLHGEDASSKFYSNIEFKSCKSKRLKCNRFSKTTKFEFDKQNDEFRRKETLSYDAMVFTVFDSSSEIPVLTAIVKNKESMDETNKAIKLKQKAFFETSKGINPKGKESPKRQHIL